MCGPFRPRRIILYNMHGLAVSGGGGRQPEGAFMNDSDAVNESLTQLHDFSEFFNQI